MKAKTIKHASWIVGSLLLIAVYASIIVGVTFSLFTDEVSSKNNHIQAGTLDVELFMSEKMDAYANAEGKITENKQSFVTSENKDGLDMSVDTNPMISIDNAMPGYYGERKLKIKNNSTIQIDYFITVVTNGFDADIEGTLKDALTIIITIGEEKHTYKGGSEINSIVGLKLGANVLAKKESLFSIRYEIDESAGNEFQGKNVNLDFTILAQQVTSNN